MSLIELIKPTLLARPIKELLLSKGLIVNML